MVKWEIAWLAGILEGEGCFRFNGTPLIRVAMTDEDVVFRVACMLNTRVRGPIDRGNYKPVWAAEVGSTKAAGWMMTLLPLLGFRRAAKVKEVLRQWKAMPGNANAAKTHCKHGHPFNETNTYYRSGRKNERACRVCTNRRSKIYQARKFGKAMDE